jgi:class 3 adenylate cyclase
MHVVPDPGIPGAGSLDFRFLVNIDIEDFSQRSAAGQAQAQDDLEHAMSKAAASAGLDRATWYRQLGGDGELAVLPAGADGLSVVADYPRSLASELAEINRSPDRGSRLRVRMAIHHGTVYPGPLGPVSIGPITVSRLVDAPALRRILRQRPDLDIALIVSDAVYREVVQSGFHELDPEMFHRITIRVKGKSYIGYLYIPELMFLAVR